MQINPRIVRLLVTTFVWFGFSLGSLPATAQQLVFNLASAYAPENFHTKNLLLFADDVSKATTGRVGFTIHSNGSLLKPAEIFGAVRDNKLDAGEVIMSSLAKERAIFGMDALPFIVSSYADASSMWKVSRPAIEKVLDEKGLLLLYAVPWPPQNLYSITAMSNAQQFKGMRMRTYNPATVRIAELTGAKPVTLQSVDLAKSIADGGLDMMITSSPTGVETKAWSNMRYYYKVNAWIPKNIVFIQKKAFAKLDSDLQKKVLVAAKEAEARGWKMSQEVDSVFESQLASNKIKVEPLESYLRIYLDRIGETLAREWLKQAGVEELQLLLKYTTERSMK